MQPICPRCGAPLDPANTAPSHSGAVHPQCVRIEDASPPRPIDYPDRAAPKYGGPPLLRYGCSLAVLLLLATIVALVLASRTP
jgi:hypothetical protein